jgi:hypothetical protein
MKKIYFALMAFIILNNAFGQVSFGLKAGGNLANIKIDASVDKKAILQFHAGGMLWAGLTEKLFIQPELLYSIKGFNSPSIDFIEDHDIRLSYIATPILLGYQVNKNVSLMFGPEFGFLTDAKADFGEASFDRTDSYSKVDIGVDLAISFKPAKKVGFDLRYNYGIKSLDKVLIRDTEGNTTYGAKTANRVLQLGIFYNFLK